MGLIFVNVTGRVERVPCLIVDRSQDGSELSVGCGLQQGQRVDLMLDEDLSKPKSVLAQALEGLEKLLKCGFAGQFVGWPGPSPLLC